MHVVPLCPSSLANSESMRFVHPIDGQDMSGAGAKVPRGFDAVKPGVWRSQSTRQCSGIIGSKTVTEPAPVSIFAG